MTLYVGEVSHVRLRPKRHRLRYRVFWMLLDLDRLDETASRLRLFSHNAANVFALCDRDYGDGSDRNLREQADATLRDASLPAADRIQFFTMPRIFGYSFNPISIYYCYDAAETLFAIIYEVHNTFGERYRYALPWHKGQIAETAKAFYVSPFLGRDMIYLFDASAPDQRVTLKIEGRDREGSLIIARLYGARTALTDVSLLRLLVKIPLLTLKVTAAIHWQAAKMWVKGYVMYGKRSS